MRTRTKQVFRIALASLSLAGAAIVSPRTALAEADRFGLGDGHSGAYAAVAANEVINAYAPLTADAAAGAPSIAIGGAVGAPGGFIAGDLILIWRATGIAAAEAPSASAVRIDLASNALAGGRVGTFELARVQAATATTITTTKPLLKAWGKDHTQVVKVPEFTTVDVPAAASLTAVAWQTVGTGFAGGILVFLANGTVTNDGQLNTDGRGFRGGEKDGNSAAHVTCTDNDNTEANGYAAKGEGVAPTTFGGTDHGGRGNRANGAGGGNCVDNGGGGGGGFGAGGAGGNSILGQNRSGLGGVGLDYSLLTRLSMGGGGGAGEQKNGVGSGGGAGGGTIFVRARVIAGAGLVTAKGADALNAGLFGVESDGAGGGGAGGAILIRAVGTVACGDAQTKGGKGGDTTVVGTGPFGAGGGGGGGRILIQSKSSVACPVNVDPGPGGQSGVAASVASAGVGGQSEPVPAPGGNYCFSNPTADPQCANPSPVCDPATGFCNKCTGPFGGGTAGACSVEVQPVCSPTGACNPCDGDFATAATSACQLNASPYCFLTGPTTGACGKCTTNADCTAGHAGTACNATIGACGDPCTDDSQCKSKEWCAQGVCVPKTPNGDHVPNVPPIDGQCTAEKGKRVCLSAVCETDDDRCGLHNGSPCGGVGEKCRSKICFPTDKLCGKPDGEPCADPGDCRSDQCTAGVCSGCKDDTNCATGQVCDKDKKQCVPGCREVGGNSNCPPPKQCSKHDGAIGVCVDSGAADGGADGGNPIAPLDSNVLEGGGCACRTTMPISGSPFALGAAAVGALLLARHRRKRRESDNDQESS